jgi:hypothetical protein
MKAKLIKHTEPDFYFITNQDGSTFATTDDWHFKHTKGCYKLSVKNCQVIEKGYDLENMADLYGAKIKGNVDFKLGANQGFEEGFLKSLELLGDKKFTKDDMIKFMQFIIRTEELENTSSVSVNTANYYLEKFCEQTQKLEWDVEIVMNEPIGIGDKYTPDNFPQLDADGCLILKRI